MVRKPRRLRPGVGSHRVSMALLVGGPRQAIGDQEPGQAGSGGVGAPARRRALSYLYRNRGRGASKKCRAEGAGFEPAREVRSLSVFKTDAIGRSATPPT